MDKNEGIDGFGLFSFIKQQPPSEELNENLSSEDFDISTIQEQSSDNSKNTPSSEIEKKETFLEERKEHFTSKLLENQMNEFGKRKRLDTEETCQENQQVIPFTLFGVEKYSKTFVKIISSAFTNDLVYPIQTYDVLCTVENGNRIFKMFDLTVFLHEIQLFQDIKKKLIDLKISTSTLLLRKLKAKKKGKIKEFDQQKISINRNTPGMITNSKYGYTAILVSINLILEIILYLEKKVDLGVIINSKTDQKITKTPKVKKRKKNNTGGYVEHKFSSVVEKYEEQGIQFTSIPFPKFKGYFLKNENFKKILKKDLPNCQK